MNIKQRAKSLFLILIILFTFLFVSNQDYVQEDLFYIKKYKLEKDLKNLQKIVDATVAQGVVVYDTNSNIVLAGKNIENRYSLASLTKIVTSVIVYEKDKKLLNEIREMMKTSSNEEAEKLALNFATDRLSQAEYMEKFTTRFGDFKFRNVSGLDIVLSSTTKERLPGGESDLLSLLSFIKEYYFKYPEIFDQTIINQGNTNVIVNQLSFLNAGKTGFTNLSGGNLFVSIQKGLDRQIFIIVLNSTEKNRFVDVQNIADFLLQSSI